MLIPFIESVTIPTPAPAAPALTSAAPPAIQRQGRIKIKDRLATRYIDGTSTGSLPSTTAIESALEVELIPRGADVVSLRVLVRILSISVDLPEQGLLAESFWCRFSAQMAGSSLDKRSQP